MSTRRPSEYNCYDFANVYPRSHKWMWYEFVYVKCVNINQRDQPQAVGRVGSFEADSDVSDEIFLRGLELDP